jgi:hypothetical protein
MRLAGDSRSTDSAAAASKRASVIHTGGSLPALGATEGNGASMPKPRELFHEGLGSERFRAGLACWRRRDPASPIIPSDIRGARFGKDGPVEKGVDRPPMPPLPQRLMVRKLFNPAGCSRIDLLG